MAIKKSELYSSLWSSCDELRGMDASQYKDYVLVLLFIKYVSDKYAGVPFGAIIVPKGSTFTDMAALKGKPDIGDQINKKIVAPRGSGSLLLKVGDEATAKVTLYGQEKDAATSALARMNMILHDHPGALVLQGNTLADPKFKDGDTLKTFDYVVANPPFSDKRWSTGVNVDDGPYDRFSPFGTPPAKQGDYAYLLHIVRSLKSTGKGACILPHGVLFRGNAEADIRRSLVRKGYIKGIIGLPPNLFYGTGIPACIVVVDKLDAQARKGTFMIDASAGFMKDGPKNRLRAQDIHRIVDVFNKAQDVPRYARLVSFDEIEKNEFNLNLPRYIDSQTPEDRQDIEGHLKGGIPVDDIDALQRYWDVCPGLRKALFKKNRPGYVDLAVDKAAIKTTIYDHPEFTAFIDGMNAHFAEWRQKTAKTLKALKPGLHPRQLVNKLGEDLLAHYADKPLIDAYDVYQHLMDYWDAATQDDCYLIADGGWTAETYRMIETKRGKDGKTGKSIDRGWACDLVPKPLIVARYFAKEQAAIDQLATELEGVTARLSELEEEHGGEEGAFSELEKVNRASVVARLKELDAEQGTAAKPSARGRAATAVAIAAEPTAEFGEASEPDVLKGWLALSDRRTVLKDAIKVAEYELDDKALVAYLRLTESDVKLLVVDDKWLATLAAAIHRELDRASQALARRVGELAGRYEKALPELTAQSVDLDAAVNGHLRKMGFVWN